MLYLLRNPVLSKPLSIVFSAIILSMSGCSYYKASSATQKTPEDIVSYQDLGKEIYIHHGGECYKFTEISTSDALIQGKFGMAPDYVAMRYTNPNKPNRYRPKDYPDEKIVTEVHIYISEYSKAADSRIHISPKAIERIFVYDHDSGATVASWIFTGIMSGAGATGLVLLIMLLLKSSCPFIYAWNGNNYEFIGEIYSGAIQPGLERDDYLPIPGIVQDNEKYSIKISNEVREIQYTNIAELIVCDHPSNVKVLPDRHGKIHTFSELLPPEKSFNLKGKDIKEFIVKKDSVNYFGDEIEIDQEIRDGIILYFNVPEDATKGKLLVNAKNSLWLDYLFSKFHEMFGEDYQRFQKKQKGASSEKLNKWYFEQNLPLSVSVKEKTEWKQIDHFNLIGPMAFKEDVIELDVLEYQGQEIQIKLESGFLFWEIDYVAMDFTRSAPDINVRTLSPIEAFDATGKDHILELTSDDDKYYVQPEVGDKAVLKYMSPEKNDVERTVFLHSKGYYLILRDQTGNADKKTIRKFRKKSRFPEYSLELYHQLYESYASIISN